jgi:hypothetical protein
MRWRSQSGPRATLSRKHALFPGENLREPDEVLSTYLSHWLVSPTHKPVEVLEARPEGPAIERSNLASSKADVL